MNWMTPQGEFDAMNAKREEVELNQCTTGAALQGLAARQQAIDKQQAQISQRDWEKQNGFRPTLQSGALQGSAPRCECHDCTQARWRMSIEGQLHGAIKGSY